MKISKNLEFDKVLNLLVKYSTFTETREEILSLNPSIDKDYLYHALKETDEARLAQIKLGRIDLLDFDLKDTMSRIRVSAPLSIPEIFEVLKLVDNTARMLSLIKRIEPLGIEHKELDSTLLRFTSLKNIRDAIYKVLSDDGSVLDNASLALYQIRHKLRLEESRLSVKTNQLLDSLSSKMSEQIVTIRNSRKAFPIKIEYKNQVSGILLGESASGQTVYIEPFQLVEIENKIESLKEEEKREIDRILYELSIIISENYEILHENYLAILHMDLIISKALYAIDTDSVMPTIKNEIKLIDARHPLIDKDKIVKNTISLDSYKTMIITGPNTGGKTVVLKTMGLLSVMFQSGLLIPVALGSSIPIFNEIYSDIGDEQSIEQSLSTFSSHMTKIVDITNNICDDSLILLDELGSGTDPKEGASLAISIIDYIKKYNVYSFITTHYPELKNYAYLDENIVNASVEFDVNTLKPTYKLLTGFTGKSNAFLISERLGLSKDIIDHASEISYSLKDSSNLLMETLEKEEERARLEREKYEALNVKLEEDAIAQKNLFEEEKEKIKKEYDNINKARERVLVKAQRNADALLDEISKLKDKLDKEKDLDNEEFKSLRKKVDNLYEERLVSKIKDNREINVGDTVRVLEFNKTGVVTQIKNGKYSVDLGNFRSVFTKDDLEYAEAKKEILTTPFKQNQYKSKIASNRLDLRGMRYEEAKVELETFLDTASLSNLKYVDIIHGYGTLALRNMVIDFAKHSSLVESFRPGDETEGGRGVTVITLK
ncbi:MAG: endonuclease MutS2 [Gammaproteobacteria bacterium]|nr:endonuclease MutS2 [Gammaproteobacteria bacterium]